jgi:sugar phosphate isomerase/epimerase
MHSRRQFNKLLAQSGLATFLGFTGRALGAGLMTPGVQLYTVRDLLASDPQGTFDSLSRMGFDHAEWFDPLTLVSQGPMARDSGISISSCHILAPFINGDKEALAALHPEAVSFGEPERLLDTLATSGVSNLVLAYLREDERKNLDQYRRLIDRLNAFGELGRERGIQLAYHNHAFELAPLEDVRPFDLMVQRFDPELVKFELDVFWLSFAGVNPAQMIHKLGPRCALLHLKDLKRSASGSPPGAVSPDMFVELGQGEIDFPAILAAARAVGVAYYYIEQDWTAGEPLHSLQMSLNYIRSIK